MRGSRIGIGVIGLGTVGGSVVGVLRRNRALVRERCGVGVEVRRAVDLDRKRLRAIGLAPQCLGSDFRAVLADPDVQIVVELIGGVGAAREVVLGALRAGKHVVTANKALLAAHWQEIFSLAQERRCAVGFEASVMAGVPVIRSIEEGLAGNVIPSLLGILNGTSNFILTRMAGRGMEFGRALNEARRKGLCEANASLDIDGHDAAQKLSILGSLALGKWLPPAEVHREGIGGIEREHLAEAQEQFGYVLRPLAIFKHAGGRVEARVHPTFVPRAHPLASVEDEFNAILITAETAGSVLLVGKGAGAKPAASGVISDVIGLARAIHQGGHEGMLVPLRPTKERVHVAPIEMVESKFYLRFSVIDRPGVLSYITGVLGKNHVSIATCDQRGRSERGTVPVIIITHRAREGAVRKALAETDSATRIVKRATVAIRIEE
ncbi:MAG: homoserine dehydrogenase [Candidatus Brocadiia bacterium]